MMSVLWVRSLGYSRRALAHKDRARAAVTRIRGADPKATIQNCASVFLDVYKEVEDREHLRENLLKAGLPE